MVAAEQTSTSHYIRDYSASVRGVCISESRDVPAVSAAGSGQHCCDLEYDEKHRWL